jgi:hypothetical protein
VQDYRDQGLSTDGIDWHALFIWSVLIVAFCFIFQLCTHILPSRIAAMIMR